MAIFLLTCCSLAQGQSHLAMSEKNQKLRTIYLKIKGPEDAAKKMRASFAEAVADKEMFLADDPRQAASKVDVTIKEQHNVEKQFYAELVSATLVARDGKSTAVYSCNKVTDGKGYSTITRKAGSTSLMKDVPAKSTIRVEEGSQASLIEGLQKEIRDAGFDVVSAEKEADFQLKDIKLIKAPVTAAGVERNVQSSIKAAGGPVLNFNDSVMSHISIHEPIAPEAEACRASLQHIGQDDSTPFIDVALADVAMIAQFIK